MDDRPYVEYTGRNGSGGVRGEVVTQKKKRYNSSLSKTALIFAAMGDHGGVCHILLEHGVNLESTDREGLSALSWACLKGQRSTAQILLDAGARVSHRDRVGRNPMHLGRE